MQLLLKRGYYSEIIFSSQKLTFLFLIQVRYELDLTHLLGENDAKRAYGFVEAQADFFFQWNQVMLGYLCINLNLFEMCGTPEKPMIKMLLFIESCKKFEDRYWSHTGLNGGPLRCKAKALPLRHSEVVFDNKEIDIIFFYKVQYSSSNLT